MVKVSDRLVPVRVQPFWAALQRGAFITDATAEAGTYREKGHRWMVAAGGIRPRRGRELVGRCLSCAEREEIALGRAQEESIRSIAARRGRDPSPVSRELRRHTDRNGAYRATTTHALAYRRAGRPKAGKLTTNPVLRATRWNTSCSSSIHRSRSPAGCGGRIRTTRRCRYRTRRSISRRTCSSAVVFGASCCASDAGSFSVEWSCQLDIDVVGILK